MQTQSDHPVKVLFLLLVSILILSVMVLGLGGALRPLLVSFVLAYLSFPLIRILERRGIGRNWAVLGVFISLALVGTAALLLVVPSLVREANQFAVELPQTAAVAIDKLEHFALDAGFRLDVSKESVKAFIVEHSSAISGEFLKTSSNFLRGVFSSFVGAILFLLNLLLIPLFFIHLVNNFEAISAQFRELIPNSWRPKLREYAELTNKVLSGYVRGQSLVALCLAVLYGFGLWLVGVRFGLIIGLATGILSVIPYVGPIFGFTAAMIMALANYSGMGTIGLVVLVFMIVQALEGLLITPMLVGDKVGLAVLPTLLALIIGGNLFGFAGMIMAIPVAAVLKTVLSDLKSEYKSLEFYKRS